MTKIKSFTKYDFRWRKRPQSICTHSLGAESLGMTTHCSSSWSSSWHLSNMSVRTQPRYVIHCLSSAVYTDSALLWQLDGRSDAHQQSVTPSTAYARLYQYVRITSINMFLNSSRVCTDFSTRIRINKIDLLTVHKHNQDKTTHTHKLSLKMLFIL